MSRILLVLLLLTLFSDVRAQERDSNSVVIVPPPKYTLTAELGGNGGVYSLNYHHHIHGQWASFLFGSAGISVLPRGPLITLSLPVSVNWYRMILKRNSFVLGTGQTLILSTTKGGYIRGTFRAAYRVEFRLLPIFFEFAYTPFYSYLYNFQWDNWVGVSFGWNLYSWNS